MAKKKRLSARLTFARNVRRERRLREISQEELAERAGVHRTYVGEIERGTRNPSIDVMERLADALALSIETLLRRS